MSTTYNQGPSPPPQTSQHHPPLAPRHPHPPSSSHTQQQQQQEQQQQQQQPPPNPPSPTKPAYPCLYPECAGPAYDPDTTPGPFVPGTSFTRHADLQRHIAVVHLRASLRLVDCPFPGCHRVGAEGFTRRDKMTDHLREVHRVEVPKRQGGKRS